MSRASGVSTRACVSVRAGTVNKADEIIWHGCFTHRALSVRPVNAMLKQCVPCVNLSKCHILETH